MVMSISDFDEEKGTQSKSSLKCKPGFMSIEIGSNTWKSALSLPPDRSPKIKEYTYAIQKHSTDNISIIITDPKQQDSPQNYDITKNEESLSIKGDGSILKVIPYDQSAVASEINRQKEASRPADPIKEQPLTGTINQELWMPILARRSAFQPNENNETIRVEITIDKPILHYPSKHSSLIVELPTQTGEYPFSNSFNITFYTPPSRNKIVVNGILAIYKVTDTVIEFGLTARGEDGLIFNGKMTADVSQLKNE